MMYTGDSPCTIPLCLVSSRSAIDACSDKHTSSQRKQQQHNQSQDDGNKGGIRQSDCCCCRRHTGGRHTGGRHTGGCTNAEEHSLIWLVSQ